jgi:hypothetical protein
MTSTTAITITTINAVTTIVLSQPLKFLKLPSLSQNALPSSKNNSLPQNKTPFLQYPSFLNALPS